MGDEVYYRLAKALDTLPQGFPATESGLEIRILKKIFTPDEAELFCDLRLTAETAEQIAARTGRPLEGLEAKLTNMWERGELFGAEREGVKTFRMAPWVIGLYEFQLNRMDREFAQMCKEYAMYFGPQLLSHGPPIMQTIPIEAEIPNSHEALPYERVSFIIENGRSFLVNDCICKKEEGLLGKPCSKPVDVCLAISDEPEAFKTLSYGRAISKEEAYQVLRRAEDAALVHLTHNVESGHWFICNCCGCCCGMLQACRLLGSSAPVNSHFCAEIDPDICSACGVCADERCQVKAIEEVDGAYRVSAGKCIGCGLCVTTCPTEAIRLVRKKPEEIVAPPKDDQAWLEERARSRGVDYSAYK